MTEIIVETDPPIVADAISMEEVAAEVVHHPIRRPLTTAIRQMQILLHEVETRGLELTYQDELRIARTAHDSSFEVQIFVNSQRLNHTNGNGHHANGHTENGQAEFSEHGRNAGLLETTTLVPQTGD